MTAKLLLNKLKASMVVTVVLLSFSCNKADDPIIETVTDYSKSDNWLALPSTDYNMDVFYLYPTAWHRTDTINDPNICEIDNAMMRDGAQSAYARQATAFETVGNIYAPYYRQADMKYLFSLPFDPQQKVMGDIPTSDAIAAFDYYLEHYNNGRPFILAGHSQGSNVLLFLLADYLKQHKEVNDRVIAAYVIGYSVTNTYLNKNPHLKFALGPDDLGVIISFNTQSPNAASNPVVLPGAYCINPISWTRETTKAETSEGLGSYLPFGPQHELIRVPQYADAAISTTTNGAMVLICTTANEDAIGILDSLTGFPQGVYHSFDYPFYFYNIMENAKNRVDKYFGH
jgi:hypothetical protein